jgi:predicted RNase H-like HicB family nuclease
MRYPIAIEPGTRSKAWGVVVPDLPGCHSAGDSLDEALSGAPEAIALWIEDHVDRIGAPPSPSSIDVLRRDRRFRGWVWALVEVDLAKLADRTERINITMSKRLLRRVDAHARKSGDSRSGFLARGALRLMSDEPATGARGRTPAKAAGRRPRPIR